MKFEEKRQALANHIRGIAETLGDKTWLPESAFSLWPLQGQLMTLAENIEKAENEKQIRQIAQGSCFKSLDQIIDEHFPKEMPIQLVAGKNFCGV